MEVRSGHSNLEEFVIEVPDRIIGVLMRKVKEENSTLNNLRKACHPAKIWIPFRATDRLMRPHDLRRLIIRGESKDIIDTARIILYQFIKNETGIDIVQMHPLISEQIALERPWLELFASYSCDMSFSSHLSGRTLLQEHKQETHLKRKSVGYSDCESSPTKKCSKIDESNIANDELTKVDDDDNPHIIVTPEPWPHKTIKGPVPVLYPHESEGGIESTEASLIVISAVGKCDDDNQEIARILELP